MLVLHWADNNDYNNNNNNNYKTSKFKKTNVKCLKKKETKGNFILTLIRLQNKTKAN